MEGRETAAQGAVVYCLIPHDLAATLHEPLRRHFAADPGVRVVVNRRETDRRGRGERRAGPAPGSEPERRQVHRAEGRRVDERRAYAAPVSERPLPRAARAHADRIQFVERVAPSGRSVDDAEAARLVTQFQAGRPEAFDELYLRYFEYVYSYLRVLLRDPHEAEDVAQVAFTRVFHGLAAYQDRGRPFRAWLFVIARNCAYDQLERTRRHRELREVDEPVDSAADAGLDDAEAESLEWVSDSELMLFLERLPLAQRQVLFLRFVMDLTHDETALILGRTPDGVRTLQKRALRFLRERLTAVGARCGHRPRMGLRRYPQRQPVLRARLLSLTP